MMPNLLYVTPELIKKLHQHPAYSFWAPIVDIFPIRPIPLDERAFHPRPLKVKNGELYLTSDMKFVYSQDNLLSFLYVSQDLSFRLTAKDGILHTLDGKQFTGILGKVAEVVSTSDVNLVNTGKVFHPFFDNGNHPASTPTAPQVSRVEPPAIQKSTPKKKVTSKADDTVEKALAAGEDETGLIFGKYDPAMCEELVQFRSSSKKSYAYLGTKYDVPVDDVKAIIRYHSRKKRVEANSQGQEEIAKIPADIREQIVRMKKISKKSYNFLSDRFELPVALIQDICAEHLKRPRHRRT